MIKDTLAQDSYEISKSSGGNSLDRIPPVRITIRTKITLPFLILAVGLAITAAYIVSRIVFDTIDERFLRQLTDSGLRVSEGMVRHENELLEQLRLHSHSQGVTNALNHNDVDGLYNLSLGIAANGGDEVVEFLDSDGELILSMRHRFGGDVADYERLTSTGIDYSSFPFIKNIIDKKVDKAGDKFAGLIRSDWSDVFYVAGPVLDDENNLFGVVLVGKTLPTLLRQLNDEALAQVTFYDPSGQVLDSTFVNPERLDGAQAKTILDLQDSKSLRRDLGPNRLLTISNLNYQEILGPWEIRENEDLGVVGISLPYKYLIYASIPTRIQLTGLIALMVLLVIVVGVSISGIITRPIRRLVKASSDVAQGDLSVVVDPEGNDEIAVLTQTFNNMVTSLSQSKQEILQAYDCTLEGWSTALELRDRETNGHTRRVTEMTIDLAMIMDIENEELINLRRGALLHDIGKMGIPDSILLKPGELTPEEWVIMRKHPIYAYNLLWPIEFLRPAIDIPYCHHEKWNGTGYPRGLSGDSIPLAARIFAIIDVWDAMRSDRPYRAALTQDRACEYIFSASGKHFDPFVVDAFFDMLSQLPCKGPLERNLSK
jgi:HD-GYP domain-containing protein (c-di-GMP phosphodiesterase class II)